MSLRLFFKWRRVMSAIDFAKLFLINNPSLLKGGIDENHKLNTLLCFSNLMYLSVYEKKLIDDKFEKIEGYPVVKVCIMSISIIIYVNLPMRNQLF